MSIRSNLNVNNQPASSSPQISPGFPYKTKDAKGEEGVEISEMKRSLLSLLLAAMLVASPLARPTLVQAARPLVFQAEGVGAGDCHAQTAETACLQTHCYWCKSAAVPSSCYSEDEASQLPPAVFQCDKAPSVTSWELTEVRMRC
jgi:hypothetical protein